MQNKRDQSFIERSPVQKEKRKSVEKEQIKKGRETRHYIEASIRKSLERRNAYAEYMYKFLK